MQIHQFGVITSVVFKRIIYTECLSFSNDFHCLRIFMISVVSLQMILNPHKNRRNNILFQLLKKSLLAYKSFQTIKKNVCRSEPHIEELLDLSPIFSLQQFEFHLFIEILCKSKVQPQRREILTQNCCIKQRHFCNICYAVH